jgi:hypothetical protein
MDGRYALEVVDHQRNVATKQRRLVIGPAVQNVAIELK